MSEPKTTKRRDSDPVRVQPDGRVVYWTGGKPRAGSRRYERCIDLPTAELRAQELRARFGASLFGRAPQPGATLTDLMGMLVEHLRAIGDPAGNESNWASGSTQSGSGSFVKRDARMWSDR